MTPTERIRRALTQPVHTNLIALHMDHSRRRQDFGAAVRHKLVDRGLSVSDLAKRLSPPRSREAVSRAINKGHFPKIREEILKVLEMEAQSDTEPHCPRQPATRPPLARMRHVLQLLADGEPFNASTVANELNTSAKTIRRDLRFMRDELGVRFTYDEVNHSYIGGKGFEPVPVDSMHYGADNVSRVFQATPGTVLFCIGGAR